MLNFLGIFISRIVKFYQKFLIFIYIYTHDTAFSYFAASNKNKYRVITSIAWNYTGIFYFLFTPAIKRDIAE